MLLELSMHTKHAPFNMQPSEHFPNGFTELSELAAGAGAGLGLCLSPTGGSSGPIQQQRVK